MNAKEHWESKFLPALRRHLEFEIGAEAHFLIARFLGERRNNLYPDRQKAKARIADLRASPLRYGTVDQREYLAQRVEAAEADLAEIELEIAMLNERIDQAAADAAPLSRQRDSTKPVIDALRREGLAMFGTSAKSDGLEQPHEHSQPDQPEGYMERFYRERAAAKVRI